MGRVLLLDDRRVSLLSFIVPADVAAQYLRETSMKYARQRYFRSWLLFNKLCTQFSGIIALRMLQIFTDSFVAPTTTLYVMYEAYYLNTTPYIGFGICRLKSFFDALKTLRRAYRNRFVRWRG